MGQTPTGAQTTWGKQASIKVQTARFLKYLLLCMPKIWGQKSTMTRRVCIIIMFDHVQEYYLEKKILLFLFQLCQFKNKSYEKGNVVFRILFFKS